LVYYHVLKGAVSIFQDYNIEVIRSVTIPNVSLNNIKLEKCKFYCGDWKSFLELLELSQEHENDKFDYIFTSETIYNTENYPKLLNIFRRLLKKTGVMYPFNNFIDIAKIFLFFSTITSFLAAKTYYFGVGGGLSQFEDLLKKDNIFNYSTSWECSNGVKRAIIKITWK